MGIDEQNYEKAKFGTFTAWEQRKRNQQFRVRYSAVSAYPTPGNFECHNKFHFLILVLEHKFLSDFLNCTTRKIPKENFRLGSQSPFLTFKVV